MARTAGVTAASPVPFRREFPHETPLPAPEPYRDYRANDTAEAAQTRPGERLPPQMLSDEDLGVLMEARLAAEEATWEHHHLRMPWDKDWNGDWTGDGKNRGPLADASGGRVYLPLAFARAARPLLFRKTH